MASLDVWRGLVMVLMAVDHAAVFLGQHPEPEGLMVFGRPLRPEFASTIAWFTRFVTHYCAPSFVFLAGTSVVLLAASRQARGHGQLAISGHLLVRGALLVVLEYTLVRWGWGSQLSVALFQVIACIGVCLVLSAFLRFVPGRSATLAGLVLLFGHPLLTDAELFPAITEMPRHWRSVLLVPDPLASQWPSVYPVVPWLALFLLGIGWGKALQRDRDRALARTWIAGVACLVVWLVLRTTDGLRVVMDGLAWGDIETLGTTTPFLARRGWMDFFMMSKYPPAADFAAWTLGGGLLLCAALSRGERAAGKVLAPLRLIGRAPLFFYVVHLYLYRLLAEALVVRGWLRLESYGSVWLLWGIGIVLLWPACAAFGWLKRRLPGFPLDLF